MSKKENSVQVRRGEKAESVTESIFLKLARHQELIQNDLINQVAADLPDIDHNTTNALVRKSLNRQKGGKYHLREQKFPKRKYWSLTPTGLIWAFAARIINLNDYSRAFLTANPNERDLKLAIYEALAKSKELSKKVEADLDKGEFQRILPRELDVIDHLSKDKVVRERVGIKVMSKISRGLKDYVEREEKAINSVKKTLITLT